MKIAILGDIALIGKYSKENSTLEEIKKRFSEIKPILNQSDYVIANLESPFTNIKHTNEAKTLPLRTNPQNVQILKYLGVDAVSLANNHFFDYGMAGAKECLKILEDSEIEYFGINGKKYILKSENTVVSLGGFCCHTTNGWYYDDITTKAKYTLNTLNEKSIFKFLEECKYLNEYPIILPHWGEENTHYPNKFHIGISDLIMSKYNTTIIGHHPHVIQGIKEYSNGVTFFSIGNFCFDDCISSTGSNVSVKQTEDNLKGIIVILNVENNKLVNYEVIPYEDTEERIKINKQINKVIEKVYSDKLRNIIDWISYDNLREHECKEAFKKRLGKRDMKWILGHLNIKALNSIIQRKKNKKYFINHMKDIKNVICKENISSHKKTVVYIGNFDRPDKSAAGKRVYGIAKILEELGYNIYLLGKENSFEDKVMYSSNIFYYSFPKFSIIKPHSYIDWFERFLLEKDIRPEFVIRYGSPSLAYFDFLLNKWGKKNKIPIIADVVDWLSSDGKNLIFNIIKTIDTFLEKAIFNKQCDGLIVISNYLMEYYTKCSKKYVIIPPLVEHNLFSVFSKKVDNSKIKIIYAGCPFRKGIEIKKTGKIKDRLDLCILVISELSKEFEIEFNIYGLTEEEYRIAFPKHKELIKSDAIVFHGKVPMKEVQKEISKSDYLLLVREKTRATMAGFPTKIVESLSCGTPVITTDTSDLKDYIIADYNGHIVDINNLDEDLKTIFMHSSDFRKKMKKNCINSCKFEYSNFINQMSEFINSLNSKK